MMTLLRQFPFNVVTSHLPISLPTVSLFSVLNAVQDQISITQYFSGFHFGRQRFTFLATFCSFSQSCQLINFHRLKLCHFSPTHENFSWWQVSVFTVVYQMVESGAVVWTVSSARTSPMDYKLMLIYHSLMVTMVTWHWCPHHPPEYFMCSSKRSQSRGVQYMTHSKKTKCTTKSCKQAHYIFGMTETLNTMQNLSLITLN